MKILNKLYCCIFGHNFVPRSPHNRYFWICNCCGKTATKPELKKKYINTDKSRA